MTDTLYQREICRAPSSRGTRAIGAGPLPWPCPAGADHGHQRQRERGWRGGPIIDSALGGLADQALSISPATRRPRRLRAPQQELRDSAAAMLRDYGPPCCASSRLRCAA
ncbi:hypothetical protein ACU4GD_24220 [Cupriavidus basilensis]